MAAEDLVGSPFYQALKRAHPTLHERAAAEDWTVVVPAQWPQSGAGLTRDVLESHLLQPSPYFLGSFVTVNGRSVEMSDDERRLLPRDGWPAGAVAARVVSRDSVYSSAFKAVTVLRIDRALTGGAAASGSRPAAPMLASHTAGGHDPGRGAGAIAQLRAENEVALSWLDEALAEFNERYVSVGGFEEYTASKLSGLLEGALIRLIEGNPAIGANGDMLQSAALTLEAHTMLTCREKTLGVARAAHRQNDASIEAVCAKLQADAVSLSELLAEGESEGDGRATAGAAVGKLQQGRYEPVRESTVSEVGDLLRAMEAEDSSPRKKASLALAAWNAVAAASSGDGALDEILPSWLFCISRSKCKNLASDTVYIKAFSSLLSTPSLLALLGGALDSEASRQQFVNINLEAAVRFFLTEGHGPRATGAASTSASASVAPGE